MVFGESGLMWEKNTKCWKLNVSWPKSLLTISHVSLILHQGMLLFHSAFALTATVCCLSDVYARNLSLRYKHNDIKVQDYSSV